ncbi:SET domain containing 2 isoform X2 [Nomia melanderi]|uniref:SET domain containing 2 isoform X2 n=1 Tax=Nomia melanderi TaxID=2448451 RepID=UPI0013046668|nr:probable histone-lysine N-methyltransferase CG1716 isoform X2 [Nomia melanderi]
MTKDIYGIKMARRRKTEMKASVKSSVKYVPVRKSSRQIAKKQLEEKKINGDILQISYSNDAEDSKGTGDDQNQPLPKKNQNSLRKHNKHKNVPNSNILVINEEGEYSTSQYKKDTSESDSQDGIDTIIDPSEKLSPEDVQQVVVGNPNKDEVMEADSTELEIWSEDVIEETIICEEMEVKEDVKDDNYNLRQEDDMIVKEVLLVSNSPLKRKNFVEYTVIQNEDGTESMVVNTSNSKNTSDTEYCAMQKNICNLNRDDAENSISALCIDVPMTSSDANVKSCNLEKLYIHDKEASNDQKDLHANRNACINESEEILCKDDAFCRIDNKLADMQISESSKEIQKLVNDLSSTENITSPLQIASVTEKEIPMSIDDESSSSILDKIEQLHHPNSFVSLPDNINKNLIEPSKSTALYDKTESANQSSLKSKVIQDKKIGNQRKNIQSQQANELLYGDSETDNKIDGEDSKLSSSSDNSNDTLLSLNNCKLTEFETKCNSGSNDIDKKVEFRSRSGSTDTTGSESGSNSSGVRRSSRIRSIGLMKQRSRGRGLVTKPNIDVSKSSTQQEREKLSNNVTSTAQEIKVENPPEPQSDKENNVSKTANTFDSLTPLTTTCNTTGYDSDSCKPVKVKSRWRRSSELEMGGSSTGFGSTSAAICPTFGTLPLNATESGPLMFKSAPGSIIDVSSLDPGSSSTLLTTNIQYNVEIEQTKEPLVVANTVAVQIPKTIGAKISLSMVPELEDREMEERLSQFEYLHENLYLTERYTNKETKRMVCDCFLTEEEIERGELGCGEDCLNRLLMIECGPRCVVSDRCTNKRFQNCEYAKCEVFRTEKKGFGLRAMVDLSAGEFIMEYVGEVVDPKDFRRRAKEYSKDKNKHYYFMALKSDQIIDATMKGNVSRFINHSCDPNSETQKWTVNGELRIGFFNKKFIAAGEEITFDYHFQRYGKEAQKCYCEAPNCRGWIGETPEEEKEKTEKKEKREKDMRKKKGEKKQTDYMEDEDLEEEIDKLCSGGLKNRAHTLTLSRLMVRSRELEHRTRLLRLIQSGEQPCRRLFLDYHGLRLIWSYVMDISTNDSEEAQQFRLEVLKTLNTLPIPNKTMLMDSKIYNVVEKWSKRLYFSPNGDSPEDDQGKSKLGLEELQIGYEANEKKSSYQLTDIEKNDSNMENCIAINDVKSDGADQNLIPDLALNLLAEWSNLKEVFRIPKKERIEQMKEHEREADRGYREELEKEEKRGTSYDRHRSDRYGRNESEKRSDRRRGRESPESEYTRTKDKRVEERSSLVPIPRMTKYERRQLFAMKVAKEEEERQRRQQQESWQDHENRCLALGIDPHTTAMVDPQTGYPVFYNPSLGQWQHYPTQEGEISQQCTPVYVGGPQSVSGHSQSTIPPQNSHVLQPSISSEISPGMTNSIPSGVPPVVYTLSQTPVFNQTTTAYSLLPHCHQQYPESQLPLSNSLVHSGTPPVTIQTQPLYEHIEKQSDQQQFSAKSFKSPQPEIPAIDLPPKWKSATDARGRTYYYHVKERVSQWLPPPPDHIGVQPDSSSSSESSEDSSSSNEDDEDIEDDNVEDQKPEELELNNTLMEKSLNGSKHNTSKKVTVHNVAGNTGAFPEGKKRREGLVQERIISPRREEDRIDHKTHKGIKEKLRRQKERAKFKEHVDKIRRHRRSNKSKSHSRHGLNKLQSPSTDLSTMSERKIKDTFRINMANVMVHFLNPYRKNDCKQGRITNTEDFKHLARKLTHFVLAKELKHCKSVDELQCNENVKHKAKDFVRKYMSKFGAVYQKSTDDD